MADDEIQPLDADRKDEEDRENQRLPFLIARPLKEEKAEQNEQIRLNRLVAEDGFLRGQAGFLEGRGEGIGQVIVVQGFAVKVRVVEGILAAQGMDHGQVLHGDRPEGRPVMIEAVALPAEILEGEKSDHRAQEKGGGDPGGPLFPAGRRRGLSGSVSERNPGGQKRQRRDQEQMVKMENLGQEPDQLEQAQAAQRGNEPCPEQVVFSGGEEPARRPSEHDHQNEIERCQSHGCRGEPEGGQINGEQGDKERPGDGEGVAAHDPIPRERFFVDNDTSRPILSVLRREGKTGGNSSPYRRRMC